VEGGKLKKGKSSVTGALPELPEPLLPSLRSRGAYGIVVTGVGGTGVVTIGQLLGMAAHLEGRGVSVLDMAGLAQKGGAVFSHVQITPTPEDLFATRIAMGEADVLIGCDLIVTTSNEALSKIQLGKTRAVVNTAESPTADFVRDPNWQFGGGNLAQQVRDAVWGEADSLFVDASAMATALMGDAIYTNPFMLGFAWQKGWIPLAHETMLRAIELNGVAVESNRKAFEWGRTAAHDVEAVRRIAFPDAANNVVELKRFASTLEDIVGRRVEFLTGYQNATYAKRYADLVERVRRVESDRLQSTQLTEAVARYYFKLLAYKDEYEVARLHSDPAFRARIASQFEGDYRLNFHLAPPLMARPDPVTGRIQKIHFGAWVMPVFSILSRFKFLRGTLLDVFGYTAERRTERALIADYEALVEELLTRMASDNHSVAVQLASIPEEIRGYGHVKDQTLLTAREKWSQLLARFRGQTTAQVIRMPQKAA
jgi:indolepyruvate ferredoxin oxidoreductase